MCEAFESKAWSNAETWLLTTFTEERKHSILVQLATSHRDARLHYSIIDILLNKLFIAKLRAVPIAALVCFDAIHDS